MKNPELLQLCALLKAHGILRSERLNSKDGSLSNSLDGDLDTLSDTIFEVYSRVCKENGLSDHDMTLVNYLKDATIENMNLLGRGGAE